MKTVDNMYKITNFAEDFKNLKRVFLMNQYLLQMIDQAAKTYRINNINCSKKLR